MPPQERCYVSEAVWKTEPQGGAGYDNLDDAHKIRSLQAKYREEFLGAALDPAKWNILQQGAGQLITVANGQLTIAAGTTANAETIIESIDAFTIAFRAKFGFLISQKIPNQEIYIEMVSADPETMITDAQNVASWKFDNTGASAAYAIYEVAYGGAARLSSAPVSSGTWTALHIKEIELTPDEAQFHDRTIDSTAGRNTSYKRDQNIPDPNKKYKIRIRVKNLAAAPATNTNLVMNFISVTDYTELTAEITGSRGSQTADQALPVIVANSLTVTARIDANAPVYTDTAANLAASGTYTGTSRDGGSAYNGYNRLRVMMAHTAGLTPGHLVIEQSTDNIAFKETHRVPIPSDGLYRTFDFPWNLRYVRVKFINGVTAQTLMFIATGLIRQDGGSDFDKTINFLHSITPLAINGVFTGAALNLGGNHSFNRHRGVVYADQPGTLYCEQSRDGVAWRITQTAPVAAGTPAEFEDLVVMQFQRVRYVNGATAQAANGFELQSALVRQ